MKVSAELANALNAICKAQNEEADAIRELNQARNKAEAAKAAVSELEKVIYACLPEGSTNVLVEEHGKLFSISKDAPMRRVTVSRPAVYRYGQR
jgi:hypothetical protein